MRIRDTGQGRRRSSGPPARPLRGDGYRVGLIQPDRSDPRQSPQHHTHGSQPPTGEAGQGGESHEPREGN
eukprot:9297983-Alexandrium_andersonii.AAC.1